MTISMRALCALSLGCVLRVHPLFAAPPSAPNDPVATVNGVSITRAKLHQLLEGVYGEQALPQLIEAQLLTSALAERGQSVSEAEVDAELARLVAQDPNIQAAMDAGGARFAVVREQVRRNITVQKILTARVANPTDAQLLAFFNRFRSYYGTPAQNKLGLLAVTTKTRADQLSRALQKNPASFDALVAEQKRKATSDPIAGQSTTDAGRFETPAEFITTRFPVQLAEPLEPLLAPLLKGLATARKGQVLPVQALSPQGPFLIVKIVDRKNAVTPNLALMKAQVETDYKMAQISIAEIKKNPSNPQKLEDNVRQIVGYLAQPNAQTGQAGTRSTLRDALTFILRPAANNSLDYLRSRAKITITDPSLSPRESSREDHSTMNAVDNSPSQPGR